MLVAQGRTACLLGRLNVYPSTQKSSSETSVLSTVLYTRVGGEGVWAGSEGEPETTVYATSALVITALLIILTVLVKGLSEKQN